jgi:NAD(P)-dependent dehydrogenase (short-subunit alcohol dehydrogenase family)
MPRSHWTADNLLGLSGRTIVVTGATSCLGLKTTRALARAGASMVLAVRDTANGEAIARTSRGAGSAPPRLV